jgi:glycosyltransferase involved in cell wall biosynthesis
MKKKNLVIYTGHNELIGGDAYYIFNLINKLDFSLFNVQLFTDNNKLFQKRADAWLKKEIKINFLNTRPVLFKSFWFDNFYSYLERNKSISFLRIIYLILNIKINKFKFFNVFRFILKRLSFRKVRWNLFNIYIFYIFFKNNNNIDIFHFNNGGYPAKEAGLIAIIMAKIFSVKRIIMTFHNVPEQRYFFRPSGFIFDYFIPRFCNKIIAASDMISEQIINKRGFPLKKIITVRCALENIQKLSDIEINTIKSKLKISDKKRVLIISGNIEEPRKGHLELFKAIAKVKIICPDVLLLVVGSGTIERMHFLNETVKYLQISNNVTFLGYRTDILNLNSISEITLTPSVGIESIPFTILEGARLGKPVITTTVGACSEAVIDNVTGYVLKPFDINSLANHIVLLLNNDKIKNEMGDKSLALFNQRFLLSKAVKIHQDIYLNNLN